MKKLTLILSSLVIIAGLWLAVVLLVAVLDNSKTAPEMSNKAPSEKATPAVPEAKGTLSFSPSSGQYKEGEIFSVDIIADSHDQPIAGVDLILKYNSDILEVKAENKEFVKAGENFFLAFPAGEQDEKGAFRFSVLTQDPREVKEKIATIFFLAKKEGEVKLEFVFEKGATNDSNMALAGGGKDILSSVSGAFYRIVR
jgi:hypothetical protein